MKNIKKEERLKWFAASFLVLPLILGLLVAVAGIMPLGGKRYTYNFTAMYAELVIAVILWVSALLHRLSRKNTLWSWLTYYLVYITIIPVLGSVFFLNLIYAAFPTWTVIAPLAAMYPAAALLPFINEKLSETLYAEMVAPRSCLGTIIYMSIMSLAPIAGVFGAFLSGLAQRSGGIMGYAMMGLFFHFFFVWGTISMAYQAWEQRPWKQSNKD